MHEQFNNMLTVSSRGQKTMDGYIVAVKKADAVPPVTKAGLKEFLLELIVDGDLIRPIFLFICMTYFLIYSYKSFRFIERPSFRRLVYYLNPKVKDTDIPKRTCMSDAVMHKVERLDDIDTTLVEVSQTIPIISYKWLIWDQNISSLVSIVWDGWSSKRCRPFSSYSIQYIDSSPNDPYDWSLKSHLIAFNWTVGRHTGQMVGKDLVGVVEKFGLKNKVRSCFVYMLLTHIFLVRMAHQ